jgi:hypothetical protein
VVGEVEVAAAAAAAAAAAVSQVTGADTKHTGKLPGRGG